MCGEVIVNEIHCIFESKSKELTKVRTKCVELLLEKTRIRNLWNRSLINKLTKLIKVSDSVMVVYSFIFICQKFMKYFSRFFEYRFWFVSFIKNCSVFWAFCKLQFKMSFYRLDTFYCTSSLELGNFKYFSLLLKKN